jgi:hypothetical protein
MAAAEFIQSSVHMPFLHLHTHGTSTVHGAVQQLPMTAMQFCVVMEQCMHLVDKAFLHVIPIPPTPVHLLQLV